MNTTTTNPTTPPQPQAGATPDGHKMREDALETWSAKLRQRKAATPVLTETAFCAGYDACMAVMADSVIRLTEMRVEAEAAIAALATSRAETEEAREGENRGARNLQAIATALGLEVWSEEELSEKVATLTATLAQREAEVERLKLTADDLSERALVAACDHDSALAQMESELAKAKEKSSEWSNRCVLVADERDEWQKQAFTTQAERDTALARVRELEVDAALLDWMDEWAHEIVYGKHGSGLDYRIQLRGPVRTAIAAARAAGTGEEGAGV